ncbi:hypothetical protein GM3708_4 [Geminocystis sp. NIES-3708]|uniref:hypothetical protein n=1 Tax=Geminocystis sp. NIES-3708 TaxID=1615909 RepID=UPI0005FC6B19|nr:hypothetical protein [Geminocystis sp. NIES-3708]BAQ59600.1 hypothetical protein GM3708_4 [Geminocystis sp. NIES-3708]
MNSSKFIQSLFIGIAITVCGLIPLPAKADISESKVKAFVEALKLAAPPNKPNDGMYSPWQVLPNIIPSWTKECLGKELTPNGFDADKTAAQKTVTCIAQRELNQQWKQTNQNETQTIRNTACWWMTGNYNGCKSGTTAEYVKKVEKLYHK